MSSNRPPHEVTQIIGIFDPEEFDVSPQERLHMAENALQGSSLSLKDALGAYALSEADPLGVLIGDAREHIAEITAATPNLSLTEIEETFGFITTKEELLTVATYMTSRDDLRTAEKQRRLEILYGAARAYLDFDIEADEYTSEITTRSSDPPRWQDLPPLVRANEIKSSAMLSAAGAEEEVERLLALDPEFTGSLSGDSAGQSESTSESISESDPASEPESKPDVGDTESDSSADDIVSTPTTGEPPSASATGGTEHPSVSASSSSDPQQSHSEATAIDETAGGEGATAATESSSGESVRDEPDQDPLDVFEQTVPEADDDSVTEVHDDSPETGDEDEAAESESRPEVPEDGWTDEFTVDPATASYWGCPLCSSTQEELSSVAAHLMATGGDHKDESRNGRTYHIPGYVEGEGLTLTQPRSDDADLGTVVPADLVTPDNWATDTQRRAAHADEPLETSHWPRPEENDDTDEEAEEEPTDADQADEDEDEGWDESVTVSADTVAYWGCPLCSSTNESLVSIAAHLNASGGVHKGEGRTNRSYHMPGYTEDGVLKYAQPRTEDADLGTIVPAELVDPDHWASEPQRKAADDRVSVPIQTEHSDGVIDRMPDSEEIISSAVQRDELAAEQVEANEDADHDVVQPVVSGSGSAGRDRAGQLTAEDQGSDQPQPVDIPIQAPGGSPETAATDQGPAGTDGRNTSESTESTAPDDDGPQRSDQSTSDTGKMSDSGADHPEDGVVQERADPSPAPDQNSRVEQEAAPTPDLQSEPEADSREADDQRSEPGSTTTQGPAPDVGSTAKEESQVKPAQESSEDSEPAQESGEHSEPAQESDTETEHDPDPEGAQGSKSGPEQMSASEPDQGAAIESEQESSSEAAVDDSGEATSEDTSTEPMSKSSNRSQKDDRGDARTDRAGDETRLEEGRTEESPPIIGDPGPEDDFLSDESLLPDEPRVRQSEDEETQPSDRDGIVDGQRATAERGGEDDEGDVPEVVEDERARPSQSSGQGDTQESQSPPQEGAPAAESTDDAPPVDDPLSGDGPPSDTAGPSTAESQDTSTRSAVEPSRSDGKQGSEEASAVRSGGEHEEREGVKNGPRNRDEPGARSAGDTSSSDGSPSDSETSTREGLDRSPTEASPDRHDASEPSGAHSDDQEPDATADDGGSFLGQVKKMLSPFSSKETDDDESDSRVGDEQAQGQLDDDLTAPRSDTTEGQSSAPSGSKQPDPRRSDTAERSHSEELTDPSVPPTKDSPTETRDDHPSSDDSGSGGTEDDVVWQSVPAQQEDAEREETGMKGAEQEEIEQDGLGQEEIEQVGTEQVDTEQEGAEQEDSEQGRTEQAEFEQPAVAEEETGQGETHEQAQADSSSQSASQPNTDDDTADRTQASSPTSAVDQSVDSDESGSDHAPQQASRPDDGHVEPTSADEGASETTVDAADSAAAETESAGEMFDEITFVDGMATSVALTEAGIMVHPIETREDLIDRVVAIDQLAGLPDKRKVELMLKLVKTTSFSLSRTELKEVIAAHRDDSATSGDAEGGERGEGEREQERERNEEREGEEAIEHDRDDSRGSEKDAKEDGAEPPDTAVGETSQEEGSAPVDATGSGDSDDVEGPESETTHADAERTDGDVQEAGSSDSGDGEQPSSDDTETDDPSGPAAVDDEGMGDDGDGTSSGTQSADSTPADQSGTDTSSDGEDQVRSGAESESSPRNQGTSNQSLPDGVSITPDGWVETPVGKVMSKRALADAALNIYTDLPASKERKVELIRGLARATQRGEANIAPYGPEALLEWVDSCIDDDPHPHPESRTTSLPETERDFESREAVIETGVEIRQSGAPQNDQVEAMRSLLRSAQESGIEIDKADLADSIRRRMSGESTEP